MNKRNIYYNMNSIEGLSKDYEDETIDAFITSPPYDNLREYNNSSVWCYETFTQVADELVRTLKEGGVICWNIADGIVDNKDRGGTTKTGSSFRQVLYFMDKHNLNLHETIIYQKPGSRFPSGSHSKRYSDVYEYVFILSKGTPKTINLLKDKRNKSAGDAYRKGGGRSKDGTLLGKEKPDGATIDTYGIRNNIWLVPNNIQRAAFTYQQYTHPAVMAKKLAMDLLRTYTNEGDLVADCFGGSGTTALASYTLNRDYVYYEVDTEYYNTAIQIRDEFMNRDVFQLAQAKEESLYEYDKFVSVEEVSA